MNSIGPDFGEDERHEPDAQPDGPRLRRSAVYPHPVVDGRERREGASRVILNGFRGMFASRDGSQEVRLEARLAMPPALTRSNVIAVISPKGGVGKTTVTFLIGNLLASRLKVRSPSTRTQTSGPSPRWRPRPQRATTRWRICLRPCPDCLPGRKSGHTYPGSPPGSTSRSAAACGAHGADHARVVRDLLAFLGQYYEIVLLDLGTGITDPLSRFAVQRADQVAVVTTPEWITATSVSSALHHLDLTRPIVILNQAGASPTADWRAAARHFAGHRLARQVTIPYDEQLRTMLDSGTYTLDALRRATRLPIKQLGVEIAEQLV